MMKHIAEIACLAGATAASTWTKGDDHSVPSVLEWRTRHRNVFENQVIGQPGSRSLLHAWESGFDAELSAMADFVGWTLRRQCQRF